MCTVQTSPEDLISQKLSLLTPSQRDRFFKLTHVPVSSPSEIPLAIFETNTVAAGPGKVGLFPSFARLNHACGSSFNVVYSFREKEDEIFVFAIRDIKEGDELLTTYFDTKRPRAERQAYLSSSYGFQCTCATCSLLPEESALSDSRLSSMATLYRQLAQWSDDSDGVKAIETVRQIWQVGSEEGYISERGRLAADATQVCLAHSDSRAAREWAELALRWYAPELGSDSIQVEEMKRVLARPEADRMWGTRKHMRLAGTSGLDF